MLGFAFALGGCGAGLITGIASSNGGGTSATVRPPELTISPVLPLVPVENTTCTVVVANSVITTGARLRVQIEAAGVIVASSPAPAASCAEEAAVAERELAEV